MQCGPSPCEGYLTLQQQQQQLPQQPLLQQQQDPSAEENTVIAATAEAVGPEAAETAPAHASPVRSNPVISPAMTRARKKHKAVSPASLVDGAAFIQVDGSNSSPPPSPASTAPTTDGEEDPQLPIEACVSSPLPPPPWSRFLPSHARTVICATCLAGCHGIAFDMCHNCFDNKNRKQLSNACQSRAYP